MTLGLPSLLTRDECGGVEPGMDVLDTAIGKGDSEAGAAAEGDHMARLDIVGGGSWRPARVGRCPWPMSFERSA
jgi:hypothetical protein